MKHHPILERFTPYEGLVPAGYKADFLGVLFAQRMFDPEAEIDPERMTKNDYVPCTGEGYFDFITLLRAVVEASDTFTMIELGAGYGYWLSQGALAARQRGLKAKLVGVEAEPGHYAMMVAHLKANGVTADEHKLLHAAVAEEDGEAWFEVGRPVQWWGQRVVTDPETHTIDSDHGGTEARLERVDAVSLQTLLADLDRVDFLHMDIQGSELGVVTRAFKDISRKVRRIVIGTHGPEIEAGLRKLFAGWACEYDFELFKEHQTEFGPVKFGDGVQVYRNPSL
jgi:FkbM family methyltransferase